MYVSKLYENQDIATIMQFVQTHPFAIIVSQGQGQIVATHIPILLYELSNGQKVLRGHIARANPQHRNWHTTEETAVLVIFSGAHSYISSSWYHHPNVPTWNYLAVHIYGRLRILEGERLYAAMSDLVHHFEQGQAQPISMEGLPAQLIRRELRGIVGFEVQIEQFQAVEKLSQNRNDADYQNIIHELKKIDDKDAQKIAEEMCKRR